MKSPRISVSLNTHAAEVMHHLCKKRNMSMSSLAGKMIEEWLEEYEDVKLVERATKIEQEIKAGERKTLTHEEMWSSLDF